MGCCILKLEPPALWEGQVWEYEMREEIKGEALPVKRSSGKYYLDKMINLSYDDRVVEVQPRNWALGFDFHPY